MNNGHLFSFFSMLIIVILTICFSLIINISRKNIVNNINNEYIEKAYLNILNKLNDYIVVPSIYDDISNIISKNRIKSDVIKLINKDSVSIYNEVYLIVNNYSSEETLIEEYSNNINDIYVNNLFITKEYNLINSILFSNYFLLFLIVLSISLIVFVIILTVINKFKYLYYSLISSSLILLILSFIIYKYFNINYINDYYSGLINSVCKLTVNNMLILSIVYFILGIVINFYNRSFSSK